MVKSKGQKIFNVFNIIIMTLLAFCFLAPYWMIFIASFTEETVLITDGYTLFPRKLSLDAYIFILSTNDLMLRSIFNSVVFTLGGVVATTCISMLYAYPLSRHYLRGTRFFNFYMVIPMLFGGGLIPTFLIVTSMFDDSYLAIIVPSAMTPWYAILMRNYFASLPDSFEEAAKIDGAGHLRVLWKIYLPLSKPIIATIALYTAVAFWNNWVGPMLYITSKEKYPIQYLVQQVMLSINNIFGGSTSGLVPTESVKMACIVLASLPVIIVYPFLQKYFINGTIVGGVKE